MNESKQITLSDGRVATIRPGKGRDVRKAQGLMGKDQSFYMNCLMHLLITIDGRTLTAEEFDDLEAGDYMTLMGEVAEVNFTSPPEK